MQLWGSHGRSDAPMPAGGQLSVRTPQETSDSRRHPFPTRCGPSWGSRMSWLIRHLDRALLSIALILSVLWIADHIRHPLAEGLPMAIIDDKYTPPSAPSPRPSVAMPSTLPR